MKTSYAFHFAAEIDSELPFGEIPIPELCAALRQRLDAIEAAGVREAFSMFDETVSDKPETPAAEIAADLAEVKKTRRKERVAAADAATNTYATENGLKIINEGRWDSEGRYWSRILHGEREGKEVRLLLEVEFEAKATVIKSVSAVALTHFISELTIREKDICYKCRHLTKCPGPQPDDGGIRGTCAKGNPATPWQCEFTSSGHATQCSHFTEIDKTQTPTP